MRIFILIFFLFPLTVIAQDIIIKISGEELNVNVLKILENRIIYSKSDQQDTSRYSISTIDVHMIKYRDGVKAIFNESDKQEINVRESTPQPRVVTKNKSIPLIESPITIESRSYYIQNTRFHHKRVAAILRESRVQEVQLNLQKYRSSQGTARFLAYGSIPIGVITYICGVLYLVEATSYNYSPMSNFFAAATAMGGAVFLGMQAGNIYLRKVTRYQTLNKAVDAHNRSLISNY